MSCLFCNLANGKEMSHIVYETSNLCCFLDIKPISTGHTLIVTKKHYLDTEELDEITRSDIMDSVVVLSKAMK